MAIRHDFDRMATMRERSLRMRRMILDMAFKSKSGHLGSAFSAIDLLNVLYFDFLHLDPADPASSERDRFILGKGHAVSALYVVLALRGFLDVSELETFLEDGSRLPGHPDRSLLPCLDASSGSLGHGLGIGCGMALASKRDGASYRTVALLSDGECNEGSTWEAALAASQWKLDRLIAIIDYNKIQGFGRTSDIMDLEPFSKKWEAFGWHVQEVDGHDYDDILRGLRRADTCRDRPSVLIAHTTKGKGVSFMENTVDWHYWTPTEDHYRRAMQELTHPVIASLSAH